jgi:CubicO group peptidase (beta-lactamase class C family)
MRRRDVARYGAAALLSLGDPAFRASAARAARQDPKTAAVEQGFDLAALMRSHAVPGLSVAVIDGYRLAWAKGYGVTSPGGTVPVTPETLFMAGSISKPVTAVGALALVQRGVLSLDGDVNARLRSWRPPASPLAVDEKVTLARILDHTAGFTGGDFFPGYPRGEPAPTLRQVLAGESPATNAPVRLGFKPGSQWRYSGDGYLVAQALMEDASGVAFPDLMRARVFGPLGMTRSTFDQPLPARWTADAASGTLISGQPVRGGWRVQPEMAAGGLWTTAADLAKLACDIALATRGRTGRVLSPHMAADMIKPHWQAGVINILGPPGSPDRMGYGFFVGERGRFGHVGGNVGYQATMVMFADTGQGAVIMTNSDVGLRAGNVLLNRIADAYGWNYAAPPPPGG